MGQDVSDDVWRPLGFEGENAEVYDALHDGVPEWMAESFWLWMRVSMTIRRTVSPYGETYEAFAVAWRAGWREFVDCHSTTTRTQSRRA